MRRSRTRWPAQRSRSSRSSRRRRGRNSRRRRRSTRNPSRAGRARRARTARAATPACGRSPARTCATSRWRGPTVPVTAPRTSSARRSSWMACSMGRRQARRSWRSTPRPGWRSGANKWIRGKIGRRICRPAAGSFTGRAIGRMRRAFFSGPATGFTPSTPRRVRRSRVSARTAAPRCRPERRRPAPFTGMSSSRRG